LIDVVKNFRQHNRSLNYKQTALTILNSRGISELELKMSGHLSNLNYESATQHYIDFKENSKLGLALNIVTITLGLGGAILNNNEFPVIGKILTTIAIVSLIFFLIVFQKTISKQSDFYKLIEIKFFKKSFVSILLGMPLFYFYRMYFIKKMEEDLNKIA
jgi:lipopolysaccharide export system permease protein